MWWRVECKGKLGRSQQLEGWKGVLMVVRGNSLVEILNEVLMLLY